MALTTVAVLSALFLAAFQPWRWNNGPSVRTLAKHAAQKHAAQKHKEEKAMTTMTMPVTRIGLTRRIECGQEIYVTVNMLPDNSGPAEVFVKIAKPGSTTAGLMNAWVMTLSSALRRGIPWVDLREKFINQKFEPTTDEYTSPVDAVARNIDSMVKEMQCRDF